MPARCFVKAETHLDCSLMMFDLDLSYHARHQGRYQKHRPTYPWMDFGYREFAFEVRQS